MAGKSARKSLLVVGLAAAGVLLAATSAYTIYHLTDSSDSSESADESVQVLYTQTGGAGTFEKQEEDTYALTMNDVGSHASFFSDRPNRIAGALPTDELFQNLFSEGAPPNAALAMDVQRRDTETIVPVELGDPNYDASQRRLSYSAKLLPDGSGALAYFDYADSPAAIPSSFSRADLFIDGGGLSDTCYSTIATSYDLSLTDADPAVGDQHYANLPQAIYASDGEGNFELAYRGSHGFLKAENGSTNATVTYKANSGEAPYDEAVVHLHCNVNGAYKKDSYCYTYYDDAPDQKHNCGLETGSDDYGGKAIQFDLP